jgi:hypothetical protein
MTQISSAPIRVCQGWKQGLTLNYQKFIVGFVHANKLSLNIEKSNYIIFHSVQRKLNYEIKVFLNNQILKREFSTTYLGIAIDCHLNWKSHVSNISKKVKRNIGAISKIRHFVSIDVLMNLYYSLIHPFLTYALMVWGNTYASSIDPLFILQKKKVRLMTFSNFYDHTDPLFIKLNILKMHDLIFYWNAAFMHDFYNGNLPEIFHTFFYFCKRKT